MSRSSNYAKGSPIVAVVKATCGHCGASGKSVTEVGSHQKGDQKIVYLLCGECGGRTRGFVLTQEQVRDLW